MSKSKEWRVSGQAGTEEFDTLNEARRAAKIQKANHPEDCIVGIDRLEDGYIGGSEWVSYE